MLYMYKFFGNYGVAILFFTILTKMLLLPLQWKSKKSMAGMQRIAPKLAALEKKYKDNKQKYSMEASKLYKQEGVSMFGGCLPLLLMFPIMIGLYTVIREPLVYIVGLSGDQLKILAARVIEFTNETGGDSAVNALTFTVDNVSRFQAALASNINVFFDRLLTITPEEAEVVAKTIGSTAEAVMENQTVIAEKLMTINFNFFGLDLSQTPTFSFNLPVYGISWLWMIPLLSGLTGYGMQWVSKRYNPQVNTKQDQQNSMEMMTKIMPLFSVYIAFIVPAGLGLYWIYSNLFSAAQEPLLNKLLIKKGLLPKKDEPIEVKAEIKE